MMRARGMRLGVGAELLSYPLARRGGIGIYLRNILAALPEAARERGHALEVFWGREGPELARELGLLERPGVTHRVSAFPLERGMVRLPWEHLALPLAARRRRVDVFHFLDHIVSVVPAARRSVVTIHDLATILYPQTYSRFRATYNALMTRMAVRLAACVIAISEATRRDLVRRLGVPEERVRVIHYGLNPLFGPVEDARASADALARHGLPERFLIYVGTLEPRKNVDRLIEAYALARRQGVQVPLVLAGQRGWKYAATLRRPEELGIAEHVLFRDYIPQPDLPAVYSRTDALVFTTLYEGFGLPPLEALACGAPVITSNVSSLPEVVGDAGLLVDPRRVEAIAEAIVRVATDAPLRARLAEAGPRRAAQFSWERAARETVAVYEDAAR
jgi:glycosyltransferase involved in cell wall biosynthesis